MWKDRAVTQPDLESIDHLLTTTRAVRKRLDLTRPGAPRSRARLPAARDPGADRRQLAGLALARGRRRREARRPSRRCTRSAPNPYLDGYRKLSDAPNTVLDSSQYLTDHLHEVPVFVIPCILGRLPESPSNEEAAGFYGSILPGVWNFQLALRSRGLGSVFTTLHLAFEREAGEILGIPETVTQAALIPVAYTVGADFKPAARRPVEEITYWNGWKQTS